MPIYYRKKVAVVMIVCRQYDSMTVFLFVFCSLYDNIICGQFIFLLGRPVSEL